MRYEIRHAIVEYGADRILDDINFEIHDKEKIAIVGRNGCGKTTLLKLIAGDLHMANLDSDETCGAETVMLTVSIMISSASVGKFTVTSIFLSLIRFTA